MVIENTYNFVMYFDVTNGNPNGDPDAGNAPRVDPESSRGFITDVCLKRKIRDYVSLVKDGEAGYGILIQPDKALNLKFADAYAAENLKVGKDDNKNWSSDTVRKARDFMCRNYFDVRTFGAVMSTGESPCGIVRGPIQINFAVSESPVFAQDVTITRQAQADEKDMEKKGDHTMGKKSIIYYALYRAEGYISAPLAKQTGLSEDDLELFWNAIINMFEFDHSAARGKMCMHKLYVFRHSSPLGNAPSHLLFDRISAKANTLVPRKFSDYTITVDTADMPDGVTLTEKL